MPSLVELAERCEAATGPDRELDSDIRAALNPGEDRSWQDTKWNALSYTASLDAAMTLVAEGWIWDVTSTGTAWVMEEQGDQLFGDAATPALALCAAALRARAAQ